MHARATAVRAFSSFMVSKPLRPLRRSKGLLCSQAEERVVGSAGARRQLRAVLVCDGTQGRRRQDGGVDDSATASRFQRWQPGYALSSRTEGGR